MIALILLTLSAFAHAEVNRWSSNGPDLPGVQAIAIAPTNPGVVYAGTFRGLYKSTNGGMSWLLRLNPVDTLNILVGKSISTVAVDPASVQVVYVGVAGEGVYKSSNGGVDWTLMSNGLTNLFVNTVVIDPTAPTTVYAGTANGVFKSNDGGGNWFPANTGLVGVVINALAFDPGSPTTLYAAGVFGAFKTTNGGGSWSPRSVGLPPATLGKALAVAPSNPNILYIGMDGGGVYRSTNGATSWFSVNNGFAAPIFVNSLAVDPTNPQIAYAGINAGGVFKTINGGGRWTNRSAPEFDGFDVAALALHRLAPQAVYAAARGGVFKSVSGGGTWKSANTGLAERFAWSLAISKVSPQTIYAAAIRFDSVSGYTGGAYKSTDGGLSWFSSGLSGVAVNDLEIAPSDAEYLYAATRDGVYRSTDGGSGWLLDNDGMGAIDIIAIAVHPTNPLTLYAATSGGGGGGVFWSTNGGDTWFPRRNGIVPANVHVEEIAIAPSNPQVLYASTGQIVYKTADGGANWVPVNNGNFFGSPYDLVVDKANPDIVYAGSSGFFKNTQGGSGPWTPLSSGIPIGRVTRIVQHPSASATFYIAVDGQTGDADDGVYKTTNGGVSWVQVARLPTSFTKRDTLFDLVIDTTGSILHAASETGVFGYQIAEARLGSFQPTTRQWFLDATGEGLFNGCPPDKCGGPIGPRSDLPVAIDLNGSGHSTVGVFRASNQSWYIDSGNGQWDGCSIDDCLGPFGLPGDKAVSGDWFGLGYSSIGVFRPSSGNWILDNGNGKSDPCTIDRCYGVFGQNGDLPVVGDWRGTGRTLIGVFRPTTGQFLLDWNANGKLDDCKVDRCVTFGSPGDLPVAGDWSGTGRTAIGVFRPSDGSWLLDNGNFVWQGCLIDRCQGPFGQSGDRPLVGAW
ncbi:MAG: hypothetical protein U1E83_04710 [Methylotetracoccus sp.]